MLTRSAIVVFGVLLAATLSSCAGSDCDRSSDCGAGQICQAGSCADRCTSESDCESNRVCRAGVCELLPRCTNGDDCAGGEVCEDGICREQTAECDGDSDCPPNFTCFEGGCFPPGTRDVGSGGCAGCENGETCIDGECVRLDAGSADADDATSEQDAATSDADAGTEDAADAEDTTPDAADVTADPDGDSDPDVDSDPDIDSDSDIDSSADADAGCTGSADCPDGQICLGGVCSDPPTDTGADVAPEVVECVGTGRGQLGERCSAAADCCSDRCFGAAPNGVCSEACGSWADCNPDGVATELFCYHGGGPSTQFCAESVYLDVCTNINQCFGGAEGILCRIPDFATGLGRCTYQCGATDECDPTSACGPVDLANGIGAPAYVNMCAPVGTPCATFRDCLSGLCLEDDAGPNYCTAYCDAADPASCPTGFGCVTGIAGTLPGFGACIASP